MLPPINIAIRNRHGVARRQVPRRAQPDEKVARVDDRGPFRMMVRHVHEGHEGEAVRRAGRAVIKTTLYIPIALIVIFAGIHFYMRGKQEA